MKLGLATSFVSAYNFAVQEDVGFTDILYFLHISLLRESTMTINKYYVLVPQALEQSTHQDSDVASDMEAQRQQMVKEAQNQGGL